jgi:hypothetical protein
MGWQITALDYDAALFTNAETRGGAAVAPMLWAKWKHRGIGTAPARTGRGSRGGDLYSAWKIFEMRILNLLVEDVKLPPSEALQIAELTAKGDWKKFVIRDAPPPIDVFLIFSRTENCWGYEMLGPNSFFKDSASIVLAAARELTAVSKYCWNILHEPGRAEATRDE